ncbi:MAG: hypothetical protein ACRYFU_02820 [Janthinobacterium lividum]
MAQEQEAEIAAKADLMPAGAPKRNRKQEDFEARGKLALRASELRIARESEDLEVTQIAQCLILCGLPYVPTKETRIVRHARLANGSEVRVTFSAGLGSEMPYGSDRTLLYFLLDKAVKSGSRFVNWKDATEFLTKMRMQTASGKNYADLRKRFSRLRGLTIGVERTNESADTSVLMPVIRRSALPSSMALKALHRGQEPLPLSQEINYGVELDEIFFRDLLRFHVPVPTELLAQTRKQSQLQDICLFLHWRCYAAKSEAVIPWEALRQQFWHEDKTARRIKVRVAEAIKFLRLLWPELKAEAQRDGLWVAPPENKMYLFPQGKAARRLG